MTEQPLNGTQQGGALRLSLRTLLGSERRQRPLPVVRVSLLPIPGGGILEAATPPEGDVRPEGVNGGEVTGVSVVDDAAGWMAAVVLKIEDRDSKGGSEIGAGGDQTNAALAPERKSVGGERRKENADERNQCDDYWGFYFEPQMFVVARLDCRYTLKVSGRRSA